MNKVKVSIVSTQIIGNVARMCMIARQLLKIAENVAEIFPL